MTLSKLDASETSLDLKESVSLEKVALSCIEELSLAASKKKVRMAFDSKSDEEISGNSRLLFEMFYNLIDNAIRYTEEGGSVLVQVEGKNFIVKDTGIGIPEENQPRIFERFYRVDKSRSKATGGTGLGLAIVKHIAEVHRANIVLHSKVGVGTEIRVQFP